MSQQSTSGRYRRSRVWRWLRPALRRTRDDQRGVALVLVAASIVALFGMAALTIDVGILMQERRSLQNAADSAALAAARHLPGDPSAAVAEAERFLLANGYDDADSKVTVTLQYPYNGDDEAFQVTVQHEIPLAFAPVIGSITGTPYAMAVAKVISGFGDNYAIFALGDGSGCPATAAANVSGGVATISGIIHANGDVDLGGGGTVIDPAVTYECSYSENGVGPTIKNGTKRTGERADPVGYVWDDFLPACRFDYPGAANVNLKSKSEVWVDGAKTQLKPGVYCFGGSVSLIGSDIVTVTENSQIGVTFIARGRITFSGAGANLKPFRNGVLFYSESSSQNAIDVSGSGGVFEGLFYAPTGGIDLSGSGFQLTGGLIGRTVAVSGIGASVTADGSASTANSNPVIALIE